MSDYKFSVGEFLTKGELKAVVLCDDAPGPWPLKGYVIDGQGSSSCEWSANGRWVTHGGHPRDLMPPKPEPVECWVNLYRRTDGSLHFSALTHRTEVAAEEGARQINAHPVRTIRVSFEPEPGYAEGWDAALDKVDEMAKSWGWGSHNEGPRALFAALKGKAHE